MILRSRLEELFECDPEKGELKFKARGIPNWDAGFAGKVAGHLNNRGYVRVTVDGLQTSAHRVIWCMMTGEWPEQIDHINHDPSDNRFVNLRSSTQLDNMRNIGRIRSSKTTGVVGVRKRGNSYQAQIRVNYKLIGLGSFPTLEQAAAARRAAEQKYDFHPNHGAKAV